MIPVGIQYVLLHLDDILIFGRNRRLISQLQNVWNEILKIKDSGIISELLVQMLSRTQPKKLLRKHA